MSHPNTIIGKEFSVPVADGRARYQVTDLHAMTDPDGYVIGMAHVVLVDGGMDDYADHILRASAWAQEDRIRELVGYDERINEIFGRKS